MVEVTEVKTLRELRNFILFPFELYKKNKYWVPPLIKDEIKTLRWDKNSAFGYCDTHYWLAYQNKKIAGRIAGIINRRYIEKWGKNYARFGWVDFIDREEVSRALFNTVENWAKSKGVQGIHGPLGFTDFDPEGMLIEGFDELGTMSDIYNYPYYKEHIEKYGYLKDVDWVEYQITVPERVPERAEKIATMIMNKNKVEILDKKKSKEIRPYARGVFEVLNMAYTNLYGVVTLTEEQVDSYIKQYFPYIVPDYVKIILDKNDNIAGFCIGIPSLSKALQKARGRLLPIGFIFLLKALRKNKYVDLYLGAVRPDLQGRGINAILMTEFTKSCIRNKIISVQAAKQLEHNLLVRAHWKLYDTKQHKRRRCYIKHFTFNN